MSIIADCGAHAMSVALVGQWNCDCLFPGKDSASCSAWVLELRNCPHGCDRQCPHPSAGGTHLRQGVASDKSGSACEAMCGGHGM